MIINTLEDAQMIGIITLCIVWSFTKLGRFFFFSFKNRGSSNDTKATIKEINSSITSINSILLKQEVTITNIVKDELKDIATRRYVQMLVTSLTREFVGMKRKTIPAINALKSLLGKYGIKINSNGEYIGDKTEWHNLSEEKFTEEFNKLIREEDEKTI